jgi:hypothetical protein
MTLKGDVPTGPLQTPRGDLTPLGIAFLRRRFREFTDTGVLDVQRRRRLINELSDGELNQQFAKQPAWLEAIVQAESSEANTILDFVLKDSQRKPLTLTLVAERLQGAFAAGNTGHTIDSSILSYSVFGFVQKMLSQKDPTLSPAYEACETLHDSAMRRRWEEFKWAQSAGNPRSFFLGNVGDKRPDIVKVNLSTNEIAITDASFAYADKIHNFKTAFYKTVVERMIHGSVLVTAVDYRAPSRKRPI